jgi:hypothetical protein
VRRMNKCSPCGVEVIGQEIRTALARYPVSDSPSKGSKRFVSCRSSER